MFATGLRLGLGLGIDVIFGALNADHHTSHDSVSVVRATFKVYWERETLTLSQPKTREPIDIKFEWRDYIVDPATKKIWAQSAQGFCSTYR